MLVGLQNTSRMYLRPQPWRPGLKSPLTIAGAAALQSRNRFHRQVPVPGLRVHRRNAGPPSWWGSANLALSGAVGQRWFFEASAGSESRSGFGRSENYDSYTKCWKISD